MDGLKSIEEINAKLEIWRQAFEAYGFTQVEVKQSIWNAILVGCVEILG
jgi:hypothetical protein